MWWSGFRLYRVFQQPLRPLWRWRGGSIKSNQAAAQRNVCRLRPPPSLSPDRSHDAVGDILEGVVEFGGYGAHGPVHELLHQQLQLLLRQRHVETVLQAADGARAVEARQVGTCGVKIRVHNNFVNSWLANTSLNPHRSICALWTSAPSRRQRYDVTQEWVCCCSFTARVIATNKRTP